MGGTNLIQGLRKILGAILVCYIPIRMVIFEEFFLTVPSVRHTLLRVDVLLTAIDHTGETQLEGIHSPGENIQGISTSIHEVQFSQNTNRSSALSVYRAGKLQRFRIRYVNIGSRDGKNDTMIVEVEADTKAATQQTYLLGFEM